MADPTYPLFSVFAFLGFLMTLIPLSWHLEAWNSGTCFYMMWASIACLNQFINSVVWAGNALNPAPIWCDISIRIILGSSVGIPLASLCINRRLYRIANVNAVTVTRAEKRRDVLVDSLICVLLPILFIALQYVCQGHRFNIYEDLGCFPALYNTLPTYFVSTMWPVIIGLVSAVYCVLSLRSFMRRRAQFNEFLSSNKSLTVGRYFRLMALATTEIMFTIPLAIFVMSLNAASGLGPWISWADTHFDFGRVEQFPALLWRADNLTVVSFELTRWLTPACAFVFFLFFGFAEEARRKYCSAFAIISKRLRVTQPSSLPTVITSFGKFGSQKSSKTTTLGSLPLPVTSRVIHIKRPDSIFSSLADCPTPLSYDEFSVTPTSKPMSPSSKINGLSRPEDRLNIPDSKPPSRRHTM